MSRLNPLYIVLLFATITLISFYSVSNQKSLYAEKITETKDLQAKASDFKNLISTWTNEKYINSTIDEILKHQMIANQEIVRTNTKEGIKIKIESTSSQILDTFLNKVLNKQLIIKKLEVNSNSIELEVGTK